MVVKAFGCDFDGFLDLVRYAMYSLQPRQCRDVDSDDYHWILRYGFGDSSGKTVTAEFWFIALLLFC